MEMAVERAVETYQLRGVDMPCCIHLVQKLDQHIDAIIDGCVFQVIFNMWSK